MTAGTVVLLRHGRTAYNATMRLQGQVDIPLDAVGQWQAEEGAKALASAHRATCVVSSDLVRAADTARAYAGAVGTDVVLDARLRERGFGEWEGLTGEEISARWPDEHAAWRRGEEPTRAGAETRDEVAGRMHEAVTEHVEALGPDDTLVVVSHGAAITLAVTAMLGLDPAGWRGMFGLHNVHWSHLHRSGPASVPPWRLVAHNVGAGFPLDHWNAGPDWNLEPVSA
ncbi:histidine phosphatase family protein [Cellulosimicrobium marinum]|uniref:histidine phosphatase family protein n=1 Tax=Cellulosimicrobium marinum TaxID=1638992 RepID=UPI001E317C8B|nr:histidine phosphatase family protein [Cellulosimicrobium marinum]MCB7137975.1 histidine phosphatase family protein [Cellulosimicrobium marinum]